jgi:hypothetical protein
MMIDPVGQSVTYLLMPKGKLIDIYIYDDIYPFFKKLVCIDIFSF